MSLRKHIFKNAAMCKAKVNKNQTFTIGATNREASNIEIGDEVRVRLINVSTEKFVKARDMDTFKAPIQKTGQIHIPKDTMDNLNLRAGDFISYIAIPTKRLPSPSNGPVRERMSDERDSQSVHDRDRQSEKETFEVTMAKTGQFTVPSEVRDKMNVMMDDPVLVVAEYNGNRVIFESEIRTGNRVTIRKEHREKLDAEGGDEIEVTLGLA